MKKILIGSVVAVLCLGTPVVYADDTHQPEQGGAPVSTTAPGEIVLPKQSAAPDKSMSNAGDSRVVDARMGKAQERMKQAQAIMAKLRETKSPAKRKGLMQQHTQALRDTMGMMREMNMGMMGSNKGMGMMGGDKGTRGRGKGQGQAGGMMNMRQMMEGRMEMMQMMMEQMFERQEMLMQDGK